MLAAHTAYLSHMRTRALLDGSCDGFRSTLAAIFDCAAQLLHPLQDCEAHVAACAATKAQVRMLLTANTRAAELRHRLLHPDLRLAVPEGNLCACCGVESERDLGQQRDCTRPAAVAVVELFPAACLLAMQMDENMRGGKWGAFRDVAKEVREELAQVAASAQAKISTLDGAYAQRLMMLLDEHSDAMHFDMRFVMMQINFSGFYKAGLDGREAEFAS